MNHMKEVAKLLGVELGEKFDIEGMVIYNPFMITEDGLFDSVNTDSCPYSLERLIKGEEKIIKLPFKPKESEYYYYIDFQGIVKRSRWYADELDRLRFLISNCFRTEEEALNRKEEILEKFREVDNL